MFARRGKGYKPQEGAHKKKAHGYAQKVRPAEVGGHNQQAQAGQKEADFHRIARGAFRGPFANGVEVRLVFQPFVQSFGTHQNQQVPGL